MFDFLLTVSFFVVGVTFGVSATRSSHDYQEGSYDKIVACEKSLNREQHCVLVAVPERGGNENE